MNWALSPPPPTPDPNTLSLCRPPLPQEGGTESTSQLLDLGGCSSLDLAPFISKKKGPEHLFSDCWRGWG